MARINQGTPEVAIGEPLKLGDNGQYEVEQDPLTDRLIIRDTVNGAEAYIRPKTSQTIGASGTFLRCLVNSEPMADDGKTYPTIQEAERNADGWVFVPPTTFVENVSIDTQGLSLAGAGYGTLIDGGGSGAAIEINEKDVTIENISARTDTANSSDVTVQFQSSETTVVNVTVRNSGNFAFNPKHRCKVLGCTVEYSESIGIACDGVGSVVRGCMVLDGGDRAITGAGQDNIVVNNIITGVASHGIDWNDSDWIVGGNRIHNVGGHGIYVHGGTDNIVHNNRVSGVNTTSYSYIYDTGTSTTLDANSTGAAN